jgi:hypothetical protein
LLATRGLIINGQSLVCRRVLLALVENSWLRVSPHHLKVFLKLFVHILIRWTHLPSISPRVFKRPLVQMGRLLECGNSDPECILRIASVPRVLSRDSHLVLERRPDQQVSTLLSLIERTMWWKFIDFKSQLKVSELFLV